MKYILSFITFVSITLLTFSQGMNKKTFVTNVGTVDYYRPDDSLIETFKKNPMVWNQISYCISYLDKMQEALINKYTLSKLSKPYMSMSEAIFSIKEKSKKDRKMYQALSNISPEMFQCEYDSYLILGCKMLEPIEKDKSLIFGKDSIEVMDLFKKIAHLCNPNYIFLQSGTALYSPHKVVKYVLCDNNENRELLFAYYVTKEKEFRLNFIQGTFEDIYQIWTMYFGINDNKEVFTEFPYSKTTTINIKGISKPLNILMNPVEDKWSIRI